jgi:hypothetical protein
MDRLRRLRTAAGLGPHEDRASRWLVEEIAGHEYLRCFVGDLRKGMSISELCDEFCERAAGYYEALWLHCSVEERLLLYQIARFGFVNGNNRTLLRRVMARGLVRREGEVRLLSETFRRFVLSRAAEVQKDTVALEDASGAWDRVRIPLVVVMVAVVAFFFATQKDVVNATSAILTGLAAGLPALLKIVGMFTDRRGAAHASP